MDYLLFAIFLAACFGAGATGALFPTGPWYAKLNKPSWVPPNWLFPIMWTSIYVLISFAAARMAPMEGSTYAMAFWAAQIAFNTLWTPTFFGLRRMKGALIVMGFLWLAVAATTIAAFQLDVWAGLAMVPYIAWVSVAGMLNLAMVRLNPDAKPLEISKL